MTGNAGAIAVQCESCGAQIIFEGGQRTARCLFCDAPSVVSRPPLRDRPQPVFALGFVIEREAAAEAVSRWIRRRKMAPLGLAAATAERVTGVYLPSYLYSATALSQYQASIAENYRKFGVQENSDGKISLGSRDETEYRDLTGRHVAYVSDILVTASRSATKQDLEAIEPFDLERLRHYSPALVAGWSSEEPSLSSEDCMRLARTEAEASVRAEVRSFMPGDGVHTLSNTVQFQDESLDPILVPVWVFAIRYNSRKAPVRILVNGQTAKVGGAIPFSWAKMGLVVAAGVALVAVLVAALRILSHSLR
jgi:hypothetical protein